MVSLFLNCNSEQKDYLVEQLWELGTSGIVERDGELQAFFDERFDASRFSAHDPRWQEEAPTDWVKAFEDSWQPFAVGRRFFLVPKWRGDPAPEGRIRLTIHPGRACGTGWHPATQLSLTALEEYLKPGDTMLDLGTGSGILAEAAMLLGARFVAACDIDREAVAVARGNITQPGVALYAGSVRSVASRSVDLVMANINAETIAMLMPEIARVARDRVILTGFPERDAARVRGSLAGAFREVAELEQDGWICLVSAR
jgi:ribosomal protein L11 methyltransferase